MGVRRIKVLFVPDGLGAVKQVSISLPVLAFGLFILCCTVAWSCWLIQDYILNSAKMPKLAEIEKESGQKEREFIHLRQRVDELGRKLEGLLALDKKLRSVADLEANQREIGLLAVGGSESGSAQSEHTEVQAGRERQASVQHAAASTKGRIAALLPKSNELPGYSKHHQVSFASMTPIWPVTGFIIYAFGSEVSPGSGETEIHKGIGISTRQGAPVLAPSDGVVTSVGWEPGYGRTLLITHGYGLTTFYGNLGETFVREGQYVKNGEKIAVVGEGRLYGPYLHYEVRLNGVPVNPLQFISKKSHLS